MDKNDKLRQEINMLSNILDDLQCLIAQKKDTLTVNLLSKED